MECPTMYVSYYVNYSTVTSSTKLDKCLQKKQLHCHSTQESMNEFNKCETNMQYAVTTPGMLLMRAYMTL